MIDPAPGLSRPLLDREGGGQDPAPADDEESDDRSSDDVARLQAMYIPGCCGSAVLCHPRAPRLPIRGFG